MHVYTKVTILFESREHSFFVSLLRVSFKVPLGTLGKIPESGGIVENKTLELKNEKSGEV